MLESNLLGASWLLRGCSGNGRSQNRDVAKQASRESDMETNEVILPEPWIWRNNSREGANEHSLSPVRDGL
jgi:hypothetical protein